MIDLYNQWQFVIYIFYIIRFRLYSEVSEGREHFVEREHERTI